MIYGGVEERLSVEIKSNDQIVLKGINYKRLRERGSFSLDTFYGAMSNDSESIKGNYVDTARHNGQWSVSKTTRSETSGADPSQPNEHDAIPRDEAVSTQQARKLIVNVSSKYLSTDTGIDVEKGQRILITASGISKDSGGSQGPDGRNYAWGDPSKFVLPNANLMALIGKIGVDGNWSIIGSKFEGTAKKSGRLFLMMNDVPGAYYNDNSGSYRVEIIVQQDKF